jgi:hypothetical protein
MDSIGEHSLCNRIHGECQAISEQHLVPEVVGEKIIRVKKNKEWWKLFFKEVAVKFDEYPTDGFSVMRKGERIRLRFPRSLAAVGDAEAMKVQMEIQVFADERGYWLWEYRKNNETDHLIYRSLAGRTYDQMQEYIREIREVMAPQAEETDQDEAQRLRDRADELSVTRQSRNSAKIDPAQAAEGGEKKDEPKQLEIF